MLRISTAATFSNGVDTLQKRQREMSDAQLRLTSGKRVATPADDPTAAARAERAMAAMARADANQRALQASRSAMTLTEGAIGDATELVQQAREQVMAAGNPAYDQTQRNAIIQSLAGLRDQLLQVANRGDGAGGYVFGKQNTVQTPFQDNGGQVQANSGASERRWAAADEPMPLNLDGAATWLQADTGNGAFETIAGTDPASATPTGGAWVDGGSASLHTPIASAYELTFSVAGGATTWQAVRKSDGAVSNSGSYKSGTAIDLDPGTNISVTVSGTPVNGEVFTAKPSSASLSVFDAIDKVVKSLGQDGTNGSHLTQAVQFALRDLDQVSANLNARRTDAGAWLNRLDNIETRVAGQKLLSQTDRSDAEDLDMVQAVSDFSNKQASYDAALKAYSSVQKLSLFQYIGN